MLIWKDKCRLRSMLQKGAILCQITGPTKFATGLCKDSAVPWPWFGSCLPFPVVFGVEFTPFLFPQTHKSRLQLDIGKRPSYIVSETCHCFIVAQICTISRRWRFSLCELLSICEVCECECKSHMYVIVPYVCVCVCVWEREREREIMTRNFYGWKLRHQETYGVAHESGWTLRSSSGWFIRFLPSWPLSCHLFSYLNVSSQI